MENSPRPKQVSEWSPQVLSRISEVFEDAPLGELLRWGLDAFSPRICLATSFGPQSIVLMHEISRVRPETTVFYLDTELLFPETYELRDELSRRLGLTFTRVTAEDSVEQQAARFGPRLWARNPDRCCYRRKVLPLRRFLADKQAWITGVRNRQSRRRNGSSLVEWDGANGVVKLNPLARWRSKRVWDYLRDNDLPFNPLHEEGYPSIGCQPCTRPVRAGEDSRSGRWPGFEKSECGIHQFTQPLRTGPQEKETAR